MSYLTVEVQIDHGRVLVSEPEKLPEKATGLLTILPDRETKKRPSGLAKGEFIVPDNFNEPLPPEVIRDFEGG